MLHVSQEHYGWPNSDYEACAPCAMPSEAFFSTPRTGAMSSDVQTARAKALGYTALVLAATRRPMQIPDRIRCGGDVPPVLSPCNARHRESSPASRRHSIATQALLTKRSPVALVAGGIAQKYHPPTAKSRARCDLDGGVEAVRCLPAAVVCGGNGDLGDPLVLARNKKQLLVPYSDRNHVRAVGLGRNGGCGCPVHVRKQLRQIDGERLAIGFERDLFADRQFGNGDGERRLGGCPVQVRGANDYLRIAGTKSDHAKRGTANHLHSRHADIG